MEEIRDEDDRSGEAPDGPAFFQVLFDHSPDAHYVYDPGESRYLYANDALCEMLGHSREELKAGIDLMATIAPDDRETIQALDTQDSGRVEFRIAPPGGEPRDVELVYHNTEVAGRRVRVGSVRDISRRRRLEEKLKKDVRREKEIQTKIVRSNLRIHQITEKLKRVPGLTTDLLRVEDEEELYERAGQLLCDPQGLNYAIAAFYHRTDDGGLVLRHATTPEWKERYGPEEARQFRGLLEGEDLLIEGPPPGNFYLPLQGHGRVFGLLQAWLHGKERELLAQNRTAYRFQHDILSTIANTIGLMADNLELLAVIRKQSVVDQLTGTYNRRFLDEKVEDEFRRARRYDHELSLILLDLDGFKPINDEYGHPEGDVILKELVDLVEGTIRETDFLCRYGGDEFVIIMPETALEQAEAKAESLRRAIGAHVFHGEESHRVHSLSASFGVSSSRLAGGPDDLFKLADEALYEAKEEGRDCVRIATS